MSVFLDACRVGNADLVRQMLGAVSSGQSPDAARRGLYCATEGGHAKCVKVLIDAKADVNAMSEQTNKLLIHLASELGHSECVEVLLDGKADVNAVDWFETPLHHAAQNGHAECVRLLLDRNADVDADVEGCPSYPFTWHQPVAIQSASSCC
eukprot:NODE_2096_length_1513_cov_20.420144_g1995_i0.p1 GENE.NODE_2096_length_1513_cov_20.420144_g1995_i0~~NODE_2096_length_1513_cov_20.420144_g1995_i0.p1  ORF type:complete len:169 (+),score=36.21 NODE_2096_length_1513_cov_20.420144_g1995_i0:54-509(+)